MARRTQGLPLNTIVLAIIAIVVLVFLVLIFTGGIGKFLGQTNQLTTSNQTMGAECSEYASTLQTQIESYPDPSAQFQYFVNSQYVSSGCSVYSPYTFTLSNGSEIECGLGSNSCINNNGGSSCPNPCTPPQCIPGCELK